MRAITPTLAVCLAAGLAAGIALARPASDPAPAAPAASVPSTTAPDPADPSGGGSASGESGRPVPTEPIVIRDFEFTRVTVPAGTVVEVRNVDAAEHTVTADDGSFDTGVIAGSSAATFVAPAEPGVYPFFCAVHPSMTGELVVVGS